MLIDNIKITFSKRAVPIPPDYRPLYKISLIILILKICCRGKKSSLLKIHLFFWALKSKSNQEKLKGLIENRSLTNIWGLDPTVNRALNFAIAEKLCEREKASIKLASKGELFSKELEKSDVLSLEKQFLIFIGQSITEEKIKQLSKNWTDDNA